MPDRTIPDHPSLAQYRKQAKDLRRAALAGAPDALERIGRHHPRYRAAAPAMLGMRLSDAQLVVAREHGFGSWPEFARHVETQRMTRQLEHLRDPVNTFLEVACVDRHGWHGSGTLDAAQRILSSYPEVGGANIYTASVLGDVSTVAGFLKRDPSLSTAKGGPHQWDALTYLCFSRYLRIDSTRSDGFVDAARALLEAGADANTGWVESIDDPQRPVREPAIYGAAGLAQHARLTRLLLEHGADPNDEETPYHVPETRENTTLQILLESRRFNETSLVCVALRKADWHDEAGLRLALQHGANPNLLSKFRYTVLQHAIRRDNSLAAIEILLDFGADPTLPNDHDGLNALAMAARRGRADILHRVAERGLAINLAPLDALIAACARGDLSAGAAAMERQRELPAELLAIGGKLLCEFAANGNLEGVRCLLELGVSLQSVHGEGDPYWDVTRDTTALHQAAWRMHPAMVRELILRGAPVHVRDSKGRTPLTMAVKACVDSYWKPARTPESVAALLAAGAKAEEIVLPTGYDAIDELLMRPR